MARYFKFTANTPYCGTENTEYLELSDTVTEAELNEIAAEMAHENGESYDYLHTGWDEDFEDEEDEQWYYDSCTCNWEEVTVDEFLRYLNNEL